MNNLLSVRQVAFILKVHPLTIRRYINNKKIKAVKVGGNIRIEEEELQNFHKEVTPQKRSSKIFRSLKFVDKKFSDSDPLFRLKGRGASLKLS